MLKCKRCCAADIQLLNNHTILHARTAFVDWEVSACCDLRLCPHLLTCCDAVNHYRSLVQTISHLLCNVLQEPDRQRHLLRLWLSPDDDRPLPDYCEFAVHLLRNTCTLWQSA
jgi:hypothetical protein